MPHQNGWPAVRGLLAAAVVTAATVFSPAVSSAWAQNMVSTPTVDAAQAEAATRVSQPLGSRSRPTLASNLAYGTLSAQKLDLYMPSNIWSLPRPVVVIIHGGSFVRGDKAGYQPYFTPMLTAAGFAVANIDYRLNNNGGVSITDMVNDTQLAVRWMRANAHNLGIDPGRICLDGYSAGGTLAVAAGAANTIYPGDMAKQYSSTPVGVQCVNDNSGPTGIQLTGNRQLLSQVTTKSPPMLVTNGLHDPIVNISSSYDLVNVLNKDRVANQHIWYNGGHVFAGLSKAQLNTIRNEQIVFFKSILAP